MCMCMSWGRGRESERLMQSKANSPLSAEPNPGLRPQPGDHLSSQNQDGLLSWLSYLGAPWAKSLRKGDWVVCPWCMVNGKELLGYTCSFLACFGIIQGCFPTRLPCFWDQWFLNLGEGSHFKQMAQIWRDSELRVALFFQQGVPCPCLSVVATREVVILLQRECHCIFSLLHEETECQSREATLFEQYHTTHCGRT